MSRLAQSIALVALLIVPSVAMAHQNSVTPIAFRVEGRTVAVTASIDALDLNEALGVSGGQTVTREQAFSRAANAGSYLVRRLDVANAGNRCVPGAPRGVVVERRDGWALAVSAEYVCPHRVESLAVDYSLFFDVDPRHRGFASLEGLGAGQQYVFQSDRRRWTHDSLVPLRTQLGQYVYLGVEHIFTGYDHIAFVLGLLILAGALGRREGARHVLAVVTSFTVAHSLTLVSAALGWVTVPGRVVEPVIALSILHVAASNLWKNRPPPRSRVVVTFGFGLIHGLGFADVLRDIGLPARSTVPSLLAFNVGVELGQLAVVLGLLPMLQASASRRPLARQLAYTIAVGAVAVAALPSLGPPRYTVAILAATSTLFVVAAQRWGYDRVMRVALSSALALLAMLWAFERLRGVTVFGGALG